MCQEPRVTSFSCQKALRHFQDGDTVTKANTIIVSMEEHLKNTIEKNSQILQRTPVAIKRILDISKSTNFPKISVELKLNLISFLCVSTVH